MSSIKAAEKVRKFNRYYANMLEKIDQEMYNRSFPLTEAHIITEINYRNGCTATEVRETLGIDRFYMSRMIQRFAEEKIVMKKQSLSDKRQHLLYLTDYGRKIYNDLVENANREVGRIIQDIPKPALSRLLTSMGTIAEVFSKEQPSQPKVSIRSFKPGDVGYVAYLHGKVYDQTYQFRKMFEYYVMKGLTEFMINPDGGELWVAEVNGELAGSIAITKSSDTTAQLRWFVLEERYQGMGIGKKLMETALEFCKEQN